jgi:hypothetical protein
MMKWRVQVYEGARPVKAWTLRDLDLEQAKQEAERAVARDYPAKEFSVEAAY